MVKIGTKCREKEDFSLSLQFPISSSYFGIWDAFISLWWEGLGVPWATNSPTSTLGLRKTQSPVRAVLDQPFIPPEGLWLKLPTQREHSLCAIPPSPGEKLGMGLDEKPLIGAAQTKVRDFLFLSRGLEPGGSLTGPKLNHLINRKLPPPIHCQFSFTPLLSSLFPLV